MKSYAALSPDEGFAEKRPSRYMLVNVVANRARKISSEAEQSGIPLTEKPVTLAIREVASGALRIDGMEE